MCESESTYIDACDFARPMSISFVQLFYGQQYDYKAGRVSTYRLVRAFCSSAFGLNVWRFMFVFTRPSEPMLRPGVPPA
jgi:hypothetical protein